MTNQVALTGIKPTGTPHLGNWLGAIRPGISLSEQSDVSAYYFIADYHALTAVHDPVAMRRMSTDIAATWLALGLDPSKAVLFRQSDVPEVFELTWILSCMTTKGWMNKAHAYKAAVDKNIQAGQKDGDAGINIGLYTYPVLMAADILLYNSNVVPVGKDQVQHVEIARDIAQRLNHVFGEVLTLPKAQVSKEVAVLPGLDGRKMSKSYDNVIPLFLPPKKLKKLVNQIVTDSTPPEASKDPETSHIFQIYRAVATETQVRELADRYATGIGWGDAKKALFEVLDEALTPARTRYEQLMSEPEEIEAILGEGAKKASSIARETLGRVRAAIGVGPL